MSKKSLFNPDKALAEIKLIITNMGAESCDFHKLFKIMYFAEREHLAKYGRSIVGDKFVAMPAGPVPSNIYDIFKIMRGDSIFILQFDFSKEFEITNRYYVRLLNKEFDIDLFSESELECLSTSIEQNKNLSFPILKNKSHDSAWQAAVDNDSMSIFDIAKAGGANEELLKYISTNLDNKGLELN